MESGGGGRRPAVLPGGPRAGRKGPWLSASQQQRRRGRTWGARARVCSSTGLESWPAAITSDQGWQAGRLARPKQPCCVRRFLFTLREHETRVTASRRGSLSTACSSIAEHFAAPHTEVQQLAEPVLRWPHRPGTALDIGIVHEQIGPVVWRSRQPKETPCSAAPGSGPRWACAPLRRGPRRLCMPLPGCRALRRPPGSWAPRRWAAAVGAVPGALRACGPALHLAL